MKIQKYHEASEIWLNFKEGLHGFIYKRVKDAELSGEINQQVLIKVINSCCSDIEIKNIRSWLFQIAHNTTIDHLKQHKKLVDIDTDIVEPTEEEVYDQIAPFISSLIGFLPEKYALPLRMSDIDGMKQKDVAEKLNLSLTATKSRIQRARELLKKEIVTCFHIDSDKEDGASGFKLKSSCTPLQSGCE